METYDGKKDKAGRLASDRKCLRRKSEDEELVTYTWLNILPESTRPSRAWKAANRVLVGIGADHLPPGRPTARAPRYAHFPVVG